VYSQMLSGAIAAYESDWYLVHRFAKQKGIPKRCYLVTTGGT